MYETDLTDSQWQVMEKSLPTQRRRKYSLRLILNALLYLTKSGCQWRLLPNNFPPYPICFYYFRRWQVSGQWARLHKVLVGHERQQSAPSGQPSPSVAILDAQSIKCSERGVPDKGFDGHKKVQGRKRQLVVDTGGRLLAVSVGPANEKDRIGGQKALQKLHEQGYERLTLVLTDAGYAGRPLAEWAQTHGGWRVETAPGLSSHGGFRPQPIRWVVERSSSWLHWDRRLSREYECEPSA
ncbi:transposase IS4 family protein [Hymenobacter roseosalivarius DSM 11622]|uniref:Transposase IS4 family protein n=1 Tax=Hymenobacter roseosalivarius DSM 11622 TaxID=645990 RepID=A0A1W1UFR1_9BACT|nr:IS5 family transposase [Hymenobacter roseosalivarius]SMB79869.1 transposase IS4 family protein [Hymenobacter roseosalivarius DSM 11622]